jgi:hypothetical protein
MYSTNFHFYSRYIGTKNYLYGNPVKGLQGCGVGYRFRFDGNKCRTPRIQELLRQTLSIDKDFKEQKKQLSKKLELSCVVEDTVPIYLENRPPSRHFNVGTL